jgi:negative regulator of sigma-B (phosphoserine phosphatase)
MRPHPLESVCGDSFLVRPIHNGALLLVADGLGHGVEAERAAKAATQCIETLTSCTPALCFSQCHAAIKATRGVVMALVLVDFVSKNLSWFSVGNVEAVLIRAATGKHEHIPIRSGIVGIRLPSIRPGILDLESNDTLILVTDGISQRFLDDFSQVPTDVSSFAAHVIENYARPNDDALVLVAKYQPVQG